jgi:hypothetical protein
VRGNAHREILCGQLLAAARPSLLKRAAGLEPQRLEDCRGGAEAREPGLKHIQPRKSREQQPVLADENAQRQAQQDHKAGEA